MPYGKIDKWGVGKREAAEYCEVDIAVDQRTMFFAFLAFGELGSLFDIVNVRKSIWN